MSEINDLTPALQLPLPHPDNDLSVDVLRLRAALQAADAAIAQMVQTTADNLQAMQAQISTELQTLAPASTALSTQVWSNAHADEIENIGSNLALTHASISDDIATRAPAETALSNAVWTDSLAASLATKTVLIRQYQFGVGQFVAPHSGWYLIELVGAGGGGAVHFDAVITASVTYRGNGGGGGGGAYTLAMMWLEKGTSYAYEVGAAGLANTSQSKAPGMGGTTKFSHLQCAGGECGIYARLATTTSPGGAVAAIGLVNLAGSAGYAGNVLSNEIPVNTDPSMGKGGAAQRTGEAGKGGDGGTHQGLKPTSGSPGLIRIYGSIS